MKERVALICTTYNCRDELDVSLDTFTSPGVLELLDEIVVVDGGSTDGTWELLEGRAERTEKLRVYRVPGANISKGRNEAIKRANADIIVCFDSGTKYSDGWLRLMLKPFSQVGADVTGGATLPYGETYFERCLATLYDRTKVDIVNPSHRGIAYYKTIWEKIGGYPEHVQAGEDTWFNTQWRNAAYKYVHVPAAKGSWRVRSSWINTFRMQRRNSCGHVALGETYGTKALFLIMSFLLLCLFLLLFGFYDYRAWFLGSCLYLLYLCRRLLDKRRRSFFIKPLNFFGGIYAVSASDLGNVVGTMEGLFLFVKYKVK